MSPYLAEMIAILDPIFKKFKLLPLTKLGNSHFYNDVIIIWLEDDGVAVDYMATPHAEPICILYSEPDFIAKLEEVLET